MKAIKHIVVFLLLLSTTSCSSLLSSAIPLPNPLEESKGINTNVALGKNVEANNTKGLVTLDELKVDIGRDNSNSNVKANEVIYNTNNASWWLIGLLCLMAGQAIPTRSQYKQIKLLKETLEHERVLNKGHMQVIANSDTRGHKNIKGDKDAESMS